MFWLLFAAQLAATEPSKPHLRTLVSPDDVPVDLVTPNKLQTVAFALTVAPNGKVSRCTIETSSGNPKLDSYTCDLFKRRAKFSPGATYFVLRAHEDWWLGESVPPKSTYADLALTVAALPPDLHSPVSVRLKFAVDQTGAISQCTAEEPGEPSSLIPTACEQLTRSFKPRPAQADDGSPVVSEQDATVVFETN